MDNSQQSSTNGIAAQQFSADSYQNNEFVQFYSQMAAASSAAAAATTPPSGAQQGFVSAPALQGTSSTDYNSTPQTNMTPSVQNRAFVSEHQGTAAGAFVAMQQPADVQEGSAITVVTPSQAVVAQARSQMRRNAAERTKPGRKAVKRKKAASKLGPAAKKSRKSAAAAGKKTANTTTRRGGRKQATGKKLAAPRKRAVKNLSAYSISKLKKQTGRGRGGSKMGSKKTGSKKSITNKTKQRVMKKQHQTKKPQKGAGSRSKKLLTKKRQQISKSAKNVAKTL